jgi:membrane protease YdiL (CAAX protease family)
MSTDIPSTEPGDSARPEDGPDVGRLPESLLQHEAIKGVEDVVLAEPGDFDDGRPQLERRKRRLPTPPEPPHPGFWWAVGWCLLMLLICQIVIPLGLGSAIFVVQAIRLGGLDQGLAWLKENQFSAVFLLPLQETSHVGIFITALVALRLVAGRSWRRQVALRLPAVTHVLLAVVGAPAFWLLSAGLSLIGSRVLPTLGDLPSCFVVAALLVPIVGCYWLAVRWTTGRDWVRELAAAPLRTQVVLGPLGVLLVLVIAAALYQLVSPHVFRLTALDGNLLEESIESILGIPWWAGLLVIAVTPAFSEEFWCRAFLGRGLVGRHGFVMGIIWTSFFFGAIHLFPHQAAMAAVLGVVLHSGYVASRSLLIPMLMHFLNNSLSVLSYKFLTEASPRLQAIETDPGRLPKIWFVAAALLGAAVLWAFYTSRARLERVDGSAEPPWQPPFTGVAHPPSGTGTAVVSSWPGVLPTLAVIAGAVGLACALYWG